MKKWTKSLVADTKRRPVTYFVVAICAITAGLATGALSSLVIGA